MRAARRKPWIVAQWLFAAAVLWYAGRSLAGQWGEVGEQLRRVRPDWTLLAAASVLMLLSYVILIEAWRVVLGTWGSRLGFTDAARIWLASNLGKYVPGKVWSLLAMGALARERGGSALAAGAASVVMQLASVATGVAIASAVGAAAAARTWIAAVIAGAIIVGLVLAPRALALAAAAARSVSGRDIPTPAAGRGVLVIALATTLAAWALSGIAFQLMARAIGSGTGTTTTWIAVYAGSYVAGFVALFAPGGIGVREGALVATMQRSGLATAPEAAVIAIASRIWLTVLELIPGLIALAITRSDKEDAQT